MWDACLEDERFGVVVVAGSVTLSTVDVISYEFFEDLGDGGIVDDLVDECDDVDGVKSL